MIFRNLWGIFKIFRQCWTTYNGKFPVFRLNCTTSSGQLARYKYVHKFKLFKFTFPSFLVDLRLRILGYLVVNLSTSLCSSLQCALIRQPTFWSYSQSCDVTDGELRAKLGRFQRFALHEV